MSLFIADPRGNPSPRLLLSLQVRTTRAKLAEPARGQELRGSTRFWSSSTLRPLRALREILFPHSEIGRASCRERMQRAVVVGLGTRKCSDRRHDVVC